MPVLISLIALISSMTAGWNNPEPIEGSVPQIGESLTGCLDGSRGSTDSGTLTAGTADAAGGGGLLFAYPVESETPDIEPAISRDSKIFAADTPLAAMISRASTVIKGILIPLYLTHQSLLC